MTQITESIKNIVELTSWLSLKDIKKLPSSDRKIAKLAIEMQPDQIPHELNDQRKLSLVEKHLQQLHLKNPILNRKVQYILHNNNHTLLDTNFIPEDLLKKKSDTFFVKLIRTIKNVFGRISSQKLFEIYQQKPMNQSRVKAAAGDVRELEQLHAFELDPRKKKLLLDAVNDCKSWNSGILHLFDGVFPHNRQNAAKYLKMIVKTGKLDDLIQSRLLTAFRLDPEATL